MSSLAWKWNSLFLSLIIIIIFHSYLYVSVVTFHIRKFSCNKIYLFNVSSFDRELPHKVTSLKQYTSVGVHNVNEVCILTCLEMYLYCGCLKAYVTLKLKVRIRSTKHHTCMLFGSTLSMQNTYTLSCTTGIVFVSFVQVMVTAAVTLAVWSKACSVFSCPAGGISLLNPSQSMVACLHFFSVYVVLLRANKTCWMSTNKFPKPGKQVILVHTGF